MMASTELFAIRAFQGADRSALERLWVRVFPDDPSWNAPDVMIESKLKVQPELLLVGEMAGRVVGGGDGWCWWGGWTWGITLAPLTLVCGGRVLHSRGAPP